jgi:hypothetical protein
MTSKYGPMSTMMAIAPTSIGPVNCVCPGTLFAIAPQNDEGHGGHDNQHGGDGGQ